MCIENTHFKCLKSYYRDSRVEVTHLFVESSLIFFAKEWVTTKGWSARVNYGIFKQLRQKFYGLILVIIQFYSSLT